MQRGMRARALRMILLLLSLSIMLSACNLGQLLEFFEGPGLAPPPADTDDDAAEPVPADDEPAPPEDEEPVPPEDEAAPPEEEEPADDAPAAGLSDIEQEIFDTLNATRADAGLDELALSQDIATGARDYSCEMAETGVFEHADLAEAGVNGENIAFGQRSAAEVHQGWMDSPGHRDNRMNERWTQYGVGVCENDDGRLYFTERFNP
jgi:uncharacterized protein YkwD